jgi:hypothetical protein
LEWVEAIDRFEDSVKRIVRAAPLGERIALIDDVTATVKRIRDDLEAREVSMLHAQGYSAAKIAYALSIGYDRVKRILRTSGNEPTRLTDQVPEKVTDLREKFDEIVRAPQFPVL